MYKVFGEGDKIRFTQTKDGKTKFIFLFDFPAKAITLKEIELNKKNKLQMIGSNKKLSWKQTENGVNITIPANLKSVSEHVWVIRVSE
jgi:alpha-L-fucosidase